MENNGKGIKWQIENDNAFKVCDYKPLTLENFTKILEDISHTSAKQKFRYKYPGALLIACSDKDFKAFYNRKDIEWGPVGSTQYKLIQDRIKKLIDEEK